MFGPSEPPEREGDVNNVVFPRGSTIGDDGDMINLSSGAADTSIGLATCRIQRTLDGLERNRQAASHRLNTGA